MGSPTNQSLYCSLDANTIGLDASWIKLPDNIDFYLIFEFPEPWDRKVELSEHFPEGLHNYFSKLKSEGKRFKFLCVKPRNNNSDDTSKKMKILYYSKSDSYFVNFKKIELDVPRDQLFNCIYSLVKNEETGYNQFKIANFDTRDIFICTHSVRDQCCGTFGIDILKELLTFYDTIPNLRVWSSSHMGGHRVGPTFMEMPSGRFWGFMQTEDVDSIMNQNSDHKMILKNYRGSMGLDRYSQIADKAIFAKEGWEWFDFDKRATIISKFKDTVDVQIEFQSEYGRGFYTASIEEMGKIVFPDTGCGKGTTISKFIVTNLVKTLNY